jgi:hypothetical protein
MRMLLPGAGDLEDLRHWPDLIRQTRTETTGISTGFDGKHSRSHNDHEEGPQLAHVRRGDYT